MITEGAFNLHTLNSRAYAGNNPSSSMQNLVFRLELDASGSLSSAHPTISGSFFIEQLGRYETSIGSFISGSTEVSSAEYNPGNPVNYKFFQDFQLASTPQTGVNQKVTNKVFTPIKSEYTGSVLSPYVSLQKLNLNITRNAPDIEVAFSPSDNVDSDIANQLGAFNIGDYIGDPGYAYSSSYNALDKLRTEYFEKYTAPYNEKDFVRLVKYYDNSLFKMIKDFVPARANLSTGIIIKPHILERNKVKRYDPIFTFHTYSGSIDIGSVSGSAGEGYILTASYIDYVTTPLGYVTESESDNSPMFTGRFGGSTIENAYTFPQFEVSKLSETILQYTSDTQYITTSFNYLRNNVTGSRTSSLFLDLDYSSDQIKAVNYNFITGRIFGNIPAESSAFLNAEIQESDYTSFSRTSVRYIGSKTSSSLYNTYSLVDNSMPSVNKAYGKTSAIGHYTRKLGLFTQIVTSSFFKGQNDTTLVYLVDESGSFTELNRDNKNWEEVQNTFKAGRNATIRLFDNQKFGDQKTTDGIKATFNSGYSYFPTLYYSSSDATMSFDIVADSRNNMFKAVSNGGSVTQFGSSSLYHYTGSSKGVIVYDLFRAAELQYNDGFNYVEGIYTAPAATSSYYTVPETAQYGFSLSDLTITVNSDSGSGVGYEFFISSSNNVISSRSGISYFTGSSTPAYFSDALENRLDIVDYGTPIVQYADAAEVYLGGFGSAPMYTAFGVTSSYYGQLDFGSGFEFGDWNIIDDIASGTLLPTIRTKFTFQNYNPPQPQLTGSITLSVATSPQQLSAGTVVEFYLSRTSVGTGTTSEIIGADATLISSPKGGNPVANVPFITSTGSAEFCFSPQLSGFVGFLFVPEGIGSLPKSSLYNRYGNVEYTFNPRGGDLLIVSSSANLEYVYEIIGTHSAGGSLCLDVAPTVASQIVDGTQKVEKFLLLKKVDDETNSILTFNKRDGQTSYGFLIPDNLSPDVLANINVISAQVQTKLLSRETNNNNILGGGSF
jgi:hypothetical protein